MSVVIAIKDTEKECVVMGGDKQASLDNLIYNDATKVFNLDGAPNVCVGGVGTLSTCQTVQYAKFEDIIDKVAYYEDRVDAKYMFNELYPNIKLLLVDTGKIKAEDITQPLDSSFIFAIGENMWLIAGDGAIIENDDYLVVGSGQELAIGSLEETKGEPPIERIKKAIKACSKNTLYINDRVDIVTTEMSHQEE